jgi:hypothetical protein
MAKKAKADVCRDNESDLIDGVSYTIPTEVTENVTTAATPVTESAQPELIVTENVTDDEEEVTENVTEEAKRFVTLEGRRGQLLHGSINGNVFSLPCGTELEVDDQMYHAVKAHIIQERHE